MKNSLIAKIKEWRSRYPFLVIASLIALQIIVFYFFYWIPALEKNVFAPLVNFYALLSSKALNMFGYQTTVLYDTIKSAQFSVSIHKGCDALEPMALLVAGILAFPALMKQKLSGIIMGLLFLFLLNVVRIATLFLIGVYQPQFFEAMHIEVWQIIFIIAGIAYWFLWVRRVVSKVKPV